MRANEFIFEKKNNKRGKITRRQGMASRGINTYVDSEKANTDYVGFKLGQAMAMSDGKNNIDIDAQSWIGKRKSVHPYTEIEKEMFKQAAKAVGASIKDLTHNDIESCELADTNKTSPLKGFKGYK